jgi:type IV pilus assembly protein PilY1
MSTSKHPAIRALRHVAGTASAVLLTGMLNLPTIVQAATPPQLTISQTPLSVTSPVHPQVIFAIGNSQSMDGDLSGAIMTGSGGLGSTESSLSGSSSPISYLSPSGYTPPAVGANADLTLALPSSGCTSVTVTSGYEPYTTTCGSTEYDTSASRLNVAKEGLLSIMNQYFPSTDFALEDYSTSGKTEYPTWVYYMSNSGGFTFTNTQPAAGTDYVINPCYNYTSSSTSSTVNSNCSSIAGSGLYSPSSSVADQYMLISASSDDPDINDVLYASGSTAVFVDYGSITPATPYPPHDTLANYESNSVTVTYGSSVPSGSTRETGPTNAGYVPYSTQVMYAQRGFGYYVTGVTASTGNNVVGMTTAGTNPTSATVTAAVANFASYLAPETNSTSTGEIKALAYQSPLAGLLTGAASTLSTALAAASGDCTPPKQYVVLVTDGLPTMDTSGNNWPPLGSAAATGYGVTATFNSDGSLNTGSGTNDTALIQTINEITTLKNNGIETYVIGLGAGVDPSANPSAAAALKAMAVAGGTSSTSADGYFPATSTAALVADLAAILSNVASQNTSSSSSAANSTSLTANSELYQATFNPGSATSDAWIGDLDEYSVNASAVISSSWTWSAQAQLDAQGTNRYIATWDPKHLVGTTVTPAAVGFDWSNLSATLQGDLQPSDTYGSLRVNWIRGDHTEEQSNGGPFRTREHVLGDIVDSSPAYVGAPSDYFADASYQAFVTANASRTPMLYVGANDGMLHGFNANTGNEAMAFIPNGVFANLYQLTSPYYLYNHHFFVDGSPYVDDALLSDGYWHTLLVGGENAGGTTIYAVDVTTPSNFTSDTAVASAVKWEFSDPAMGYSYSAPIIVRSNAVTVTDHNGGNPIQSNGFAVLFGNGYNSPSGQPIFYAVDASTGNELIKINLCTATGVPASACSSSAANGLSTITAANSSGLVGVPQDMAYAGDLQGNLWGINMSNSNPAKWTVELLFQARDSSGNDQPITSAPAVTPNPNFPSANGQSYLGLMVYFGTGMFLQTSDLSSTKTQSFYGVWDNSSDLSNYTTQPTMPYTRANLQAQTISLGSYTSSTGASTPAIFSTSNPVNLSYATVTDTNPSPPPATISVAPQEGWYFDLSPLVSGTTVPAPRVFNSPEVENGGVLFSINIPPNSSSTSCGTPTSYLMNVQYASGTPFQQASIGFSGGTSIGTGTASGAGSTVTNTNPTGIFISNGYSAAPTSVRTASGTNEQFMSTGDTIKPLPTNGNKSGRVGWWQIQ